MHDDEAVFEKQKQVINNWVDDVVKATAKACVEMCKECPAKKDCWRENFSGVGTTVGSFIKAFDEARDSLNY